MTDPLALENISALGPNDFVVAEKQNQGVILLQVSTEHGLQASGLLEDIPFYFRYKDNGATLKVGDDPIANPLYIAARDFPNLEKGALTPSDFSAALGILIGELKRAPFLYEFEAKTSDGNIVLFHSWDENADAARASILAKENLESLTLADSPRHSDNRVFPSPAPSFWVK